VLTVVLVMPLPTAASSGFSWPPEWPSPVGLPKLEQFAITSPVQVSELRSSKLPTVTVL
jgi:hypothetical protein